MDRASGPTAPQNYSKMSSNPEYSHEPGSINRVKRLTDRARYDQKSVFEILDAGVVAHVGFVVDGRTVVMPMAYGRIGEDIYIHGYVRWVCMKWRTLSRPGDGGGTRREGCSLVGSSDGQLAPFFGIHVFEELRCGTCFGAFLKFAALRRALPLFFCRLDLRRFTTFQCSMAPNTDNFTSLRSTSQRSPAQKPLCKPPRNADRNPGRRSSSRYGRLPQQHELPIRLRLWRCGTGYRPERKGGWVESCDRSFASRAV